MDWFGIPQIAAILILLQRGVEEYISQVNTKRLLAADGREAGADYYPVVAVAHLSWIASIFLLIPADAPRLLAPYRAVPASAGGPLLGDRNAWPLLDAQDHHP